MTGRVRRLAYVLGPLFAAFLSACALPWQQLSLPGPTDTYAGANPLATSSTKKGVDLGNKASPETTHDRIYPGSGDFNRLPATANVAKDAAGRDAVTLNLVDASIADAARSVLGDILKLNYAVSDKVKGTVTLQTVRPVARDQLLDIFESVLKAEGAAIVPEGGLYKVVPIQEASGAAPLRPRGQGGPRLPGMATNIVPLRYVTPTEMERLLKSMVPSSVTIRAENARNLLIVTGTRSDLAAVADTITVFDVDWMRGMSFALLSVETADPDAIAQELDTIFANDRDSPTKGIVRFVPNKRLKSVLVISQRPEYLEKAQRWLRRIDLAGKATEKQVHVYHVQNRPASELAALLQKVYGAQDQARAGAGISTSLRGTSALSTSGGLGDTDPRNGSPAPAPGQISPQSPGPQPIVNPALEAMRGGGPGVSLLPDQRLSPPGPLDAGARPQPAAITSGAAAQDDRTSGISIIADEANNQLIVTANAQEFKRIRKILEHVDVSPNQVLLETTIAEVTLNDDLKFGLRWFFQNARNRSQFAVDPLEAFASQAIPGFSQIFNTPNIQVTLNALSSVTDVNVKSSPSLMVLDNKTATLQVGDEVPIITQQATGVAVAGAPVVNSVTMRNTGVVLSITPRIGDNGRVLLDVEQEVSDAIRTTSSTINSPTIQKRRVRTTVAVNDGESLILAGMIQDKATRGRDQVPIIGDVPLFGNLFKQKDDNIRRTELLIAITPRVVKNTHQVRSIAAEFRDKLNFTTRPTREAPPGRREQVDRILR